MIRELIENCGCPSEAKDKVLIVLQRRNSENGTQQAVIRNETFWPQRPSSDADD